MAPSRHSIAQNAPPYESHNSCGAYHDALGTLHLDVPAHRGMNGRTVGPQTLALPRYLDPPRLYREARKETIAAFDKGVAKENIPELREGLQWKSEQWLIANNKARFPRSTEETGGLIPLWLRVVCDVTPDWPTHVLAVAREAPDQGADFFLTHHLVLATNCWNLPAFPPSRNSHQLTDRGTKLIMTLPVVRLQVASPRAFPAMHAYLYTRKSLEPLRKTLFGQRAYEAMTKVPSVLRGNRDYAVKVVADALEIGELVQRTRLTHGMYQTAASIGVNDQTFWLELCSVWELVLGALESRCRGWAY